MSQVTSSTALLDRVRLRMAAAPDRANISDLARQESPLLVDETMLARMSDQLAAELRGTGPLEPLLSVPGITDVLVNGADQVWIDREIARLPDDERIAIAATDWRGPQLPSPTTRLFGGLRFASHHRPAEGWTTRRPMSTRHYPMEPDCMRSCRHWSRTQPSRCEYSRAADSAWTI